MIRFSCRGLTRLLALFVLPVLGVVALAFAAAALIPVEHVHSWARSLHGPRAADAVGTFLDRTAPRGDVVVVAAGVGAVLLGLALLIGTLLPVRERELSLGPDEQLRIRRRALRQALGERVDGLPGTSAAKVRVHTRRRGGRVVVRARRRQGAEPETVSGAVSERVLPVAEAFGLRTKVRSRAPKAKAA